MQRKDTGYLFALAVVALAGVLTLAALGRTIAPELWTLAGLVVGGAVGIARQDAAEPAQGVSIPGSVAPQISVNAAPQQHEQPAPPAAAASPLWAGQKP